MALTIAIGFVTWIPPIRSILLSSFSMTTLTFIPSSSCTLVVLVSTVALVIEITMFCCLYKYFTLNQCAAMQNNKHTGIYSSQNLRNSTLIRKMIILESKRYGFSTTTRKKIDCVSTHTKYEGIIRVVITSTIRTKKSKLW